MRRKIGLIGLGAMGLPMGKRLLEAGHDLAVVPHRNLDRAKALAATGATIRSAPAELAQDRDVVITSVPDVPQVQEILFGERGLLTGKPASGTLYIDMITINPTAAREHEQRLSEAGIAALDAPVSGGPLRAADGTLTIMVGGTEEAFQQGRPVLEVLGKNIIHVGGAGSGQAVKLVNQLAISVIMIANAEALTLGAKGGVPLQTMLDVIATSSGSNYLMQSWLPNTLFNGNLDGGFSLNLLMKDLSAALRWAADLGLPTFAGALAQQLYRLAQAEGYGASDYSAVARLYEESAGVELRLEGK
jgi:3-hydroxyisobutyrate dehydrogenase-like beta-hydroxyacid dehydrogenase